MNPRQRMNLSLFPAARRSSKLFVWLGLAAFCILSFVGLPVGRAQSSGQAGVIIQFGDGSITTACVQFSGESISGFDALQASGQSVTAAFDPQGAAICQIGGNGCPADNCFCDFPPNYWSYWHSSGGGWNYSQLGSSNFSLRNGEIDGWRYGGGEPPSAVYTIEQICGSAAAATATPESPTFTAPPPASATPEPSPTLEPSATPAPTETATVTLTATLWPTSTVAPSASASPSPTITLTLTAALSRARPATTVTATHPITPSHTAAPITPSAAPAASPTSTPPAAGISGAWAGVGVFLVLAGALVGLLTLVYSRRA